MRQNQFQPGTVPIQQENVLAASDSALIREPEACNLIAETLRRFHFVRLAVTGTSMLPEIWPGDLLTIQRKDPTSVQPGELALYLRQGRLFAHRVLHNALSSDAPVLLTKGDSVPLPDPPVNYEDFLGIVTDICHRGTNRPPSRNPGLVSRVLAAVFAKSTLAQSIALRLASFRAVAFPRADATSAPTSCDRVAGR